MSKNAYRIYICLILLACLLPTTLMPFSGEQENYEKRVLAQAPAVVKDDGSSFNLNFPQEFEEYYLDHFAGRPQLSGLNGAIYYYLLGESSSQNIIAGKDGWLFYASTLDDYIGRNMLSSREISSIVRILELDNEYAESLGIPFFFTVAPNKNTIYGAYMPGQYLKANEENNLKRLAEALKASGVDYIDLAAAFKTAGSAVPYYHKRDSHWNDLGAMLAYNEIMSEVSAKTGISYDRYEGAKYEVRHDWAGDLDNMLIPIFQIRDDQYYYDIPNGFTYSKPLNSPEDMEITTLNKDEAKSARLLMFRDSFLNTLHPFLSNQFGQADYSRAVPYAFNRAEKASDSGNGYDAIILEIVERNLPNLLERAPVFAAPERQAPEGARETGQGIGKVFEGRTQNGLLKLCGWVSREMITGDGTRIYVRVRGNGAEKTYEAFPALESAVNASEGRTVREEALSLSAELADCGFSLNIPVEGFAPGEYTIDIITEGSETLLASGLYKLTLS